MTATTIAAPGRSRLGMYLAILLLGPLSFLLHEYGHWAAGELLGVEMWMTLNKAGPAAGSYGSQTYQLIVALAGPAVTVAVGILAYVWARSTGSFIAYGLLFFQFMKRMIAGGITMTGPYPNDEALAGIIMGIGPYPITIGVAAFLLLMTWDAARRVRPHWAHNFGAYATSSLLITMIVFSDRFLRGLDFQLL